MTYQETTGESAKNSTSLVLRNVVGQSAHTVDLLDYTFDFCTCVVDR